MLTAIASILLAAAQPARPADTAPATAVEVDVGRFDPASFPQAAMRERRMPHNAMLTRIETILRERQCRLAGQSHRRFDIRVPYVVRLEPDGTPTRFVVADIGCRPLESFIGQIILELARVGDFRPTSATGPQWYSSELRFIMGTPVF